MFKFNFIQDDEESKENKIDEPNKKLKTTDTAPDCKPVVEQEHGILSLEELKTTRGDEDRDITFKRLALIPKNDQIMIDYIDSYAVEIDESDELAEINRTHDLVPGKYEGGLKVWELSLDLARFIYNIHFLDLNADEAAYEKDITAELKSIQNLFSKTLDRSVKKQSANQFKILELGCGHALPVLSACKYLDDVIHRTYSVSETLPELEVIIYLQDFNRQIVEDITYENVMQFQRDLNEKWSKNDTVQKTSPIKLTCQFVYGDWKDLYDSKDFILPGDYFNLILTSETIYNSENYAALLRLFKKCLVKEKEEALVLLSAKTYYFGCGGNLLEFLKLAKSSTYNFKASDNLLFNDNSVEVSQQASDSFFNSTTSTIGKEIVTLHF